MEKKNNQKRAVWAPGRHLHKGSVLSCQLPQWSLSQIHTTTTTILTQSTLTEWQKAAWPFFVIKNPTFVYVLCVYFSDFCHAKGQASADEHSFGLPEVSKCAKRWRLSSLTRAWGRYGAYGGVISFSMLRMPHSVRLSRDESWNQSNFQFYTANISKLRYVRLCYNLKYVICWDLVFIPLWLLILL